MASVCQSCCMPLKKDPAGAARSGTVRRARSTVRSAIARVRSCIRISRPNKCRIFASMRCPEGHATPDGVAVHAWHSQSGALAAALIPQVRAPSSLVVLAAHRTKPAAFELHVHRPTRGGHFHAAFDFSLPSTS